MHILFLSRWQPFPPNNGSKLRIYNLLKVISQKHQVTLLSFRDAAEEKPPLIGEIPNLVEIQTIPYKPFNPDTWRSRLGFFNLQPRFVIDTYSRDMETAITKILKHNRIDLVIASQVDMAMYRQVFRNLPALFEEVEIGVFTQRVQAAETTLKRWRNQLTWSKHRRFVGNLLESFQASTVVSEQEARLLRSSFPRNQNIRVLPNCVNLDEYAEFHTTPVPQQLIFCGSFKYEPNFRAMAWFVEQVFPHVLAAFPTARLVITGDPAGKDFSMHPNITQTGLVPDIRPLVAQSWISLAPILAGGGTRLKILEAMGLKTAVIATTKGAEGLDVQDGVHLLVADHPADFANAVCRLLGDNELRDRLVTSAYTRIAEKYDWQKLAPEILNILDKITAN